MCSIVSYGLRMDRESEVWAWAICFFPCIFQLRSFSVSTISTTVLSWYHDDSNANFSSQKGHIDYTYRQRVILRYPCSTAWDDAKWPFDFLILRIRLQLYPE